jgi:hypothetical protein
LLLLDDLECFPPGGFLEIDNEIQTIFLDFSRIFLSKIRAIFKIYQQKDRSPTKIHENLTVSTNNPKNPSSHSNKKSIQ